MSPAVSVEQVTEAAERAVAAFQLGPHSLDLISHHTNTVFHLATAHGRYVVRAHRAAGRTRDQVAGEVAWLDALAQETDVRVPSVQRTPSGEAVVDVRCGGERTLALDPSHALKDGRRFGTDSLRRAA